MMVDISIFVESSTAAIKAMPRKYGYVIQCNEKTATGFGDMEGTNNQAHLQALIDALKRFSKPARLEIWVPNPYVGNMLMHTIDTWHDNGWKNAKGDAVDPRWEELYDLLEMHEFAVVPGKHEYSAWLKNEMGRE